MRTFEVGDIVIVKENSLQVTDTIMGYIFHVNKDLPKNEHGVVVGAQIDPWVHIITEKGEVLRGVNPESLVHVTKSHYIYIWKMNEKALGEWVNTGVFQNILDAVGTQNDEIDKFITGKYRAGWWNIH